VSLTPAAVRVPSRPCSDRRTASLSLAASALLAFVWEVGNERGFAEWDDDGPRDLVVRAELLDPAELLLLLPRHPSNTELVVQAGLKELRDAGLIEEAGRDASGRLLLRLADAAAFNRERHRKRQRRAEARQNGLQAVRAARRREQRRAAQIPGAPAEVVALHRAHTELAASCRHPIRVKDLDAVQAHAYATLIELHGEQGARGGLTWLFREYEPDPRHDWRPYIDSGQAALEHDAKLAAKRELQSRLHAAEAVFDGHKLPDEAWAEVMGFVHRKGPRSEAWSDPLIAQALAVIGEGGVWALTRPELLPLQLEAHKRAFLTEYERLVRDAARAPPAHQLHAHPPPIALASA